MKNEEFEMMESFPKENRENFDMIKSKSKKKKRHQCAPAPWLSGIYLLCLFLLLERYLTRKHVYNFIEKVMSDTETTAEKQLKRMLQTIWK